MTFRGRSAALGALTAVLATAAGWSFSDRAAATIDVRTYDFWTGLTVEGDQHAEKVLITLKDGAYVVDAEPGLTVEPKCTSLSPTRAECPVTGVMVAVDLFGGDDQARLGRGVRAKYLSGELGDDQLIGADSRDVIGGRQGDDLVRGRGGFDSVSGFTGNDRIFGGRNRDVVDGGAGFDELSGGEDDDELNALDGHRDRSIDCGPGVDVAYVDLIVDPQPKHCETVRYRRADGLPKNSRFGPHCRIHLTPGAESHAIEVATRCNFTQRRLVIRPNHDILGMDHRPAISHDHSDDHFRCQRRSKSTRMLCRGRVGQGARTKGMFETAAFSCDVATHIKILGATTRLKVNRFVRKPRGCA